MEARGAKRDGNGRTPHVRLPSCSPGWSDSENPGTPSRISDALQSGLQANSIAGPGPGWWHYYTISV